MRAFFFVCAAIVAAVVVRASQDKPGVEKQKDNRPVMTVVGCVDGGWLEVRAGDRIGSYAERYKLRGSKALLKELATRYKYHLLEVTGAVTDNSRNTVHEGKTIPVGKKTRITTGSKDVPQVPSGGDAPSLEVSTFKEIRADDCR